MTKGGLQQSGWDKWHEWNAAVMRPITEWFCDAIAAAPGHAVLDAACGTGLPSLAIAQRVLPDGKVIAIDVSADMVAAARRRAAAAGFTHVEHLLSDVASLPFADGSFDATTCAFGLMFCSDPVQGASELRRVLKPGGRFAIAAWDEPSKNAFFGSLFGPVTRFLSRPPPEPGAPGPFRLSPWSEMDAVLRGAGFSEFSVEPREIWFEFESLELHWQISSDMAAPLAAAKASLSDVDLAQLREAIAKSLQPYVHDGRVRVPNTALCAWGRR
jgi:SAM-dependent methyltransferase